MCGARRRYVIQRLGNQLLPVLGGRLLDLGGTARVRHQVLLLLLRHLLDLIFGRGLPHTVGLLLANLRLRQKHIGPLLLLRLTSVAILGAGRLKDLIRLAQHPEARLLLLLSVFDASLLGVEALPTGLQLLGGESSRRDAVLLVILE
jgi:hypothetical protein